MFQLLYLGVQLPYPLHMDIEAIQKLHQVCFIRYKI